MEKFQTDQRLRIYAKNSILMTDTDKKGKINILKSN